MTRDIPEEIERAKEAVEEYARTKFDSTTYAEAKGILKGWELGIRASAKVAEDGFDCICKYQIIELLPEGAKESK